MFESYDSRELYNIKLDSSTNLRIPSFRGGCGSVWTKELPPGTMFVNGESNIRPTGGAEVYYFDLGATLTVVAKENSGIIRAVSFNNIVLCDGSNAWAISYELSENYALALFNRTKKEDILLARSLEIVKKKVKPKDKINNKLSLKSASFQSGKHGINKKVA